MIATGAEGARVENSQGIAIDFPKKQVSQLYATLDFAKRNAWAMISPLESGFRAQPPSPQTS